MSACATPAAAAVLGGVLALASGCVSLHQGGIYRKDLDEVFVAYFDNETFYRDLQFQLTEQVVSEILSSPGLRLSSKEDAEVVLTGSLLDVQQHVLAEDSSQQPLLTTVTLTVDVRVADIKTGEVLRNKRLSEYGDFVSSQGENLTTAQTEAITYLARDIVRLLEEDF
ncbi:MAG TPA: LPS assembly lipoprotein LptE [Planctomycetota bacterium]|jgi:hypothetical protein|nr:LPS assembly lipoprotein LptE [Planctomycetota bacterium]